MSATDPFTMSIPVEAKKRSENRTCRSLRHWLLPAQIAIVLCLCSACNRDTEPGVGAKGTQAESFEAKEARLDSSLWTNELLALRHERTFVQLRDDLVRATNKLAVLQHFEFAEIVLPRDKGTGQILSSILARTHSDASPEILSHSGWEQRITRLRDAGWELRQAEWSHVEFFPASQGKPASSSFEFELDGEHSASARRIILRGKLRVEWGPCLDSTALVQPRRLAVSNLLGWERSGPPGFRRSFVATPEAPQERGTFVNLHPLIVTDLNSDGNEDIVIAGANRLFLNRGEARFEPMEFVAETNFHGVRSAGLIADFNGDGSPDFLTVAGEGVWSNKLVLYAGNGSVPFTNPPIVVCPSLQLQDPSVMTAGDIDRDGDLDVWLAQYKPPYAGGQMPTPYYDANDGYPSVLLRNDGTGRFVEDTAASGLGLRNYRRTYAASFVDLNGDGDLDLVLLNDFAGVDLYYGDGQGRFTDETARIDNRHLFGMSHAVADFDGDGQLDLLAVGMNLPVAQRLQSLGLGRDDFPDRTRMRAEMAYGNRLFVLRSGRWVSPDFAGQLAKTGWSWGVTAADFDNNGALDLYLANGHFSGASSEDRDSHYWRHDIYVGSSRENPRVLYYFAQPFMGVNTGKTSWSGYQHNVLFLDTGANQYLNAAFLMDVAHESDCRAVVGADLDNDGRVDLALTEAEWMGGPTTGRHRLLVHLNQMPSAGHWIGAKLVGHSPGSGSKGRHSPIGAKVLARSPERTWVAQVITGNSFQAQHPNTVHFGLGKVARLTELKVQ